MCPSYICENMILIDCLYCIYIHKCIRSSIYWKACKTSRNVGNILSFCYLYTPWPPDCLLSSILHDFFFIYFISFHFIITVLTHCWDKLTGLAQSTRMCHCKVGVFFLKGPCHRDFKYLEFYANKNVEKCSHLLLAKTIVDSEEVD